MKKNNKLKSILGKLVLCLVCALCCVTGKETTAYANWTCECSNPENADYDSKCWKCDKYRNMRPVFDTETDKEFDYGDTVKLSWTGKVGSQGYILAVRNVDTDYRPFYNKKLGMNDDSYKIKEDLPAGKYKAAIAAIDVYDKQYWCEECIYFYVNPEPEQEPEPEYVEITKTPVVDDDEEEWISSWDTSDSDVIVVTPEEPELGVGGSTVGESESNYDSIYESLSDAGKAASDRFEQLLAGTVTDSSEDEHTKSDLDVFELPTEDVITVTTANTTPNTDTTATEKMPMDAGSWFDWFVKWFANNEASTPTPAPYVPVVEESANTPTPTPSEPVVEESANTPTPTPSEPVVKESESEPVPTPTNEPEEEFEDIEYKELTLEELIPGEFEINSPANGKIYKLGKSVTVKWQPSKRVKNYVVSLLNEDTGKITTVETTSAKYKFKGKDLKEGNYLVTVEACNNHGTTECESLRFSVTKNGKSAFTVKSSGTKVTMGGSISSDSPLEITMSSDISSYSVKLVSNTLNKTVYSKNKKSNASLKIQENYLYPGNDYTLTVVSKSGKDGKTSRTDKLSFKVALDYSKIGQGGKFQAPVTKDSDCIITVNKNEYLGDSRAEYVKTLAGNIEYLISRAEANNAFTKEQIQCLRDIYGRQLDRKENGKYVLLADNMGEYLEFRYEGAGKDYREIIQGNFMIKDKWYYANPEWRFDYINKTVNADKKGNLEFDLFGAMTVVVQNAEIKGVFFRSSTIPDSPIDYPYGNTATGVVKAGVYSFYTHTHDGFAAFQLKDDDDSLPAIYDEVTWNVTKKVGDKVVPNITITGCNIHHNYGSVDKRYSAGCLTVDKQDWAQYMSLYNFAYDEDHPNKKWSKDEQYIGKIVIERLIDVEINAHGKTFTQKATFPVTQK